MPQAVRRLAARMGGDAGVGPRDRPRLAPPAVAYPPARSRTERPAGADRRGMARRGRRGGGVRGLLRCAALRPPAAGARHGVLHRDHEERRPQHGLPARRNAGAAQRVVDADLSGQFQRHEPLGRAFGCRLLRRFARRKAPLRSEGRKLFGGGQGHEIRRDGLSRRLAHHHHAARRRRRLHRAARGRPRFARASRSPTTASPRPRPSRTSIRRSTWPGSRGASSSST